jgi:hypothetical protein
MLHAIKNWLLQGHPPGWLSLLGLLLYAHLEWYLPRTERFKANSGLEGLGNVLKALLVHKVPLIGKVLTAMATKDAPPTPAQPPPVPVDPPAGGGAP